KREPGAIYNSRTFIFKNLPKPINNYGICSYCSKQFIEESWCKKCDPHHLIEGLTSVNSDVDKFIKDTIYDAREGGRFLEWISFDSFADIKQIGGGGFSKVYSADYRPSY